RAHRAAVRALLAVRRVLRGRSVPVLLDVSQAGHEAIRLCADPAEAMIIDAIEVNARVLAQSILEPGTYDVVRQILSLDARSPFTHPAGSYAGLTFDSAHAAIENGILIGVVRRDQAILSPDEPLVIAKHDRLVVFSDAPGAPRGSGRLPTV